MNYQLKLHPDTNSSKKLEVIRTNYKHYSIPETKLSNSDFEIQIDKDSIYNIINHLDVANYHKRNKSIDFVKNKESFPEINKNSSEKNDNESDNINEFNDVQESQHHVNPTNPQFVPKDSKGLSEFKANLRRRRKTGKLIYYIYLIIIDTSDNKSDNKNKHNDAPLNIPRI